MFYAHFVLAKKGALARIWLAAHWDKKLTKAHVFETNIESSVEGILQPKVKMALRTSGHLLLGIVRIYSRKAKYLLADCNEAFIKIKMAFRPGVVDLPEGNREAAVATITLPEVFHDFDGAMPDITIDMDAQVTLNQSRAEDITLKEDYGTLSLMTDDGFGDMAFDDPEVARDATNIDEGFDHASLLLCEDQTKEIPEESVPSVHQNPDVELDVAKEDAFDPPAADGLLDESGNLFEPAGLFDDAPLGHVPLENSTEQNVDNLNAEAIEKPIEPRPDEDSDDDMYDMGPASMGAPSPPSSVDSPIPPMMEGDVPAEPEVPHRDDPLDLGELGSTDNAQAATDILSSIPEEMPPPPPPPVPPLPPIDNSFLNEDESFALAPLDATIVHGAERTVKAKRKRKLIVDEVKNISGEEMKSQLSDTSDIIVTLDLAPPTKRLMHWKETGGVEKLFALPGHPILSRLLSRSYQRHLTTRSVDNEDFGIEEDSIDLDADFEQPRDNSDVVGSARKRSRRDMDPVMQPDLSHLDSLHLDASRPSYVPEPPPQQHLLPPPPHPSLEVSSFLQAQHHLFPPPQQMMAPPPAHMIHQMLQSEVDQLSHMPHQMMHPSMVDQGPPLHTITPSLHDVRPPVLPEAYGQYHSVLDNVPQQHMLPDGLPPQMPDHLQHPPSVVDKHMQNSLVDDHMNHRLSQQEPENLNLPPHIGDEMGQRMDGQVLPPPPPIDDDVTQTCLDEYTHPSAEVMSNIMIAPPPVDACADETQITSQNADLPTDELPHPDPDPAMSLFESLNDGIQNETLPVAVAPTNEEPLPKEFPLSDDEDDYGAPSSVGPMMAEEQLADETYEQFEERILTKRTTHMLHIIHNRLDSDKSVRFSDVVRNNRQKQVAQKFYTFLVLKKLQAVELEQSTSYGELVITRGPRYDAVYNGN